MMQVYWERHPFQYEIVQILREGEWVTHVFEWVFMMVSRFAGYIMTLAVGYLILYVIESKHSLDTVPIHAQLADHLAIFSNMVINVTPELVFPGVVVLCIRAFTLRRWLDGSLYLITAITFAVLTMVLLNAFENSGITREFLSAMLFWRAGAALFYTVVVAYCGGRGGLDFKTLLRELDALRGQLDGGQQTLASLQTQLSSVQQHASTLQERVNTGQREASRLQRELDTEQQRASTLQTKLEQEQGNITALRLERTATHGEIEALRVQVEGKQRELADMRKALEQEQAWQESRLHQRSEAEQQRVSNLQGQLTIEQELTTSLRRQLNAKEIDTDTLRRQVQTRQDEINALQSTLQGEQREVSSLRDQLNTEQQRVSSSQQQLEYIQVSSVQPMGASTGQEKVDAGQGKVVHLDTSRPRKGGQEATENAVAEQVRALLTVEPGLSGRAIATRLKVSPTTATKWKANIEKEEQISAESA